MQATKRALTALLLVTAMAPAAFADGLIRDGIGAISIGRGGANLGFADNGAVIFDNPGGMTNIEGTGLMDLSVDTVICRLDYSDPDNPDADPSLNAYPLPMVGYVRRDPCSPWAWGIGVYVPAGFGSGYDLNSDVGPANYMTLGALGKILPGVAYQVTDRLSIGATLGVGLSHVELEGPFYTSLLPAVPTLIDLQGTGAAPTGGIGLQYKLTPDTVIGVAYTEETSFEFEGTARANLPFTPFGPLQSEFDSQIDVVWPRSLGVGVMHQACCCSRIGFDVVWYNWSNAFDELPITLSNPSDPIVGAILGPEYTEAYPLNWKDTVSFRLGYEWSPADNMTWRAGYVYHESPVPDSTLNPYLDGILEHAVSLGFSRCVRGGWLNVAYQYSWSPEREVDDSIIVGGDFDDSRLRAEAHWISVGYLTPF